MPAAAKPPGSLPFQRRQVVRVSLTVAIAAFAGGYLASDVTGNALADWVPRIALSVCSVAAVMWVAEIRLARQILRIEHRQEELERRVDARLRKAEYAEGYVAGLRRRPPDDDGDDDDGHLHSV